MVGVTGTGVLAAEQAALQRALGRHPQPELASHRLDPEAPAARQDDRQRGCLSRLQLQAGRSPSSPSRSRRWAAPGRGGLTLEAPDQRTEGGKRVLRLGH